MPWLRTTVGAVVCALAAIVTTAQAGEPAGVAGRELYASYCASCHGTDGRGDGPEAVRRGLRTPDLTRLHERYGSPLPRDRIASFIDGRVDVEAHGPRDMPVWGERWAERIPEPGVSDEIVRGKIVVLVEYLKSIQRPQ